MIIGPYTLSSSNSSATQNSSVRVKREGVTLVLMRFGSRSNPLGFVRNNPGSTERHEFMKQLQEAGVSYDDAMMLLSKSVTKGK